MIMPGQFEAERFELMAEQKVQISDYRFGRNRHGGLAVWVESSEKGKRFLSQISVEGETYAVRKEIYTRECYILRRKETGRYHFLDMNDSGFWLQNESFSGARMFDGDESVKIQKWLALQDTKRQS
jgi:hypothetical protein